MIVSRTEFYQKLWPCFSYDEIQDLESYAVSHYDCAPGCVFTGYSAVLRLLYQNLSSLTAFNGTFALILRRSYTQREFERLYAQLMQERYTASA